MEKMEKQKKAWETAYANAWERLRGADFFDKAASAPKLVVAVHGGALRTAAKAAFLPDLAAFFSSVSDAPREGLWSMAAIKHQGPCSMPAHGKRPALIALPRKWVEMDVESIPMGLEGVGMQAFREAVCAHELAHHKLDIAGAGAPQWKTCLALAGGSSEMESLARARRDLAFELPASQWRSMLSEGFCDLAASFSLAESLGIPFETAARKMRASRHSAMAPAIRDSLDFGADSLRRHDTRAALDRASSSSLNDELPLERQFAKAAVDGVLFAISALAASNSNSHAARAAREVHAPGAKTKGGRTWMKL